MHPGIAARGGRLGQGLGEGGEILVAELAEGLARGQADQRQGAASHIAGPVRAPAEPLGHLGDLPDVIGMPGGPLLIQVPGGLGEQQIQVGREVAFDEAPGQERPGAGALEVGQPCRRRPPHPRRQLRMGGQQPRGGVTPDPPAVRADRQRGDRAGIGDQQVRRPMAAQRDGGRGAHRPAASARAYSAASASGDRCSGGVRYRNCLNASFLTMPGQEPGLRPRRGRVSRRRFQRRSGWRCRARARAGVSRSGARRRAA